MPVTERTFLQVVFEDPEGRWELHDGQLREKPPRSFRHNDTMVYLGRQLLMQLDPTEFRVRINAGHVRRTERNSFVPDIFVFPVVYIGPDHDRADVLEVYDQPLPLVVEIWSPSTGLYDVETKFAEYRQRGDREIWRLHPFERRLTAWCREPDGDCSEITQIAGTIDPVALPGVTIDLDQLFQ